MATNNKSALNNSDFVQQAINDLLVRGLLIECDRAPIVINPLSVSTNNNKKRLILDLRKVNLHMRKQSIKYEDVRTKGYSTDLLDPTQVESKKCSQIQWPVPSINAEPVDIFLGEE